MNRRRIVVPICGFFLLVWVIPPGLLIFSSETFPGSKQWQLWWSQDSIRVALAAGLFTVEAGLTIAMLLRMRSKQTRHRRLHPDPRTCSLGAWREICDTLKVIDVPIAPNSSPTQVAAHMHEIIGGGKRPASIDCLTSIAARAAYSPDGVSPADAETAWNAAVDIKARLYDSVPKWRSLTATIDPRILESAGRR